jgi:primosomal protein N'
LLVPFGSGNRQREGFVIRVMDATDPAETQEDQAAPHTLKPLLRVIEPYPNLTPEQIELAYWTLKKRSFVRTKPKRQCRSNRCCA